MRLEESRQGRVLAIVTFFVVSFLAGLRFYRLRYFGESVDESDNLAVGWLLTQGLKIYDSVFSHHTPLAYIPVQIVAALSASDEFTHFRIIPFLFLMAASLSFLISPLRLSLPFKALSSVLFLFFAAILGPLWLGYMVLTDNLWGYLFVSFVNIWLLPAILGHCNSGLQNKYLLILAGILWGGWISGSLITLFPFVISLCLTMLALKGKGSGIDRLSAWKYLALGITLSALFYLFWLLRFGSMVGFFEQAVTFNLKTYSQFTEYSENLMGPLFGTSFVKAAQNHAYWILKSQNYVDRICEGLLLLGLFILGCFAYFHERRSIWYISGLMVGSFMLMSALRLRQGGYHAAPYYLEAISLFAWSTSLALSIGKLMITIPVITLVAFLSYNSVQQTNRYIPFSWNEDDHSRIVVQAEPTFGSGLKMIDLAPTFQYIIENTIPSDKIAAFPTMPIIYLKTKRLPAHSGVFYLPWNAKWEDSRGDLRTCRQIKEVFPKFVWLDRWKVWGRYEFADYAKCLEQFVVTNYVFIDKERFPNLLRRNQ